MLRCGDPFADRNLFLKDKTGLDCFQSESYYNLQTNNMTLCFQTACSTVSRSDTPLLSSVEN